MAKRLTPEQKQEWARKIHAQQASGLSVNQWCRTHHVVVHQFWYWRDRLAVDQQLVRSDFAELKDSSPWTITAEKDGVHICLTADSLKQCTQILEQLTC